MDHYEKIYQNNAVEYHAMIEKEDVDGSLLKTLEQIDTLVGKRILDIGTGTGRIPLLLNGMALKLVGIDLNYPMLVVNKHNRDAINGMWSLTCGDMRLIPFADGSWDVVIAGWAIGHLRSWFENDWKNIIGDVLGEMHRVVNKKGKLIICETLSTGSLLPKPPNLELADYYSWLESEWNFSRKVIQTDYLFGSVQDAARKTEFFFGSDLAEKIKQNKWKRLPEWTGVWSKSVNT